MKENFILFFINWHSKCQSPYQLQNFLKMLGPVFYMCNIPYTEDKNDEKATKKISYNSPRVKILHVSAQAFNAGARVDAA